MKTAEATIPKTKWVLDPIHSELAFKVRHMMITNVKGEFRNFSVETEGEDFSNSKIKVKIDAASISTNDIKRDEHLRSADFLDVENHKEILFEGTSFVQLNEKKYLLKGMLTIKDISNEISLDVEFGGINKDPWGGEKAGFSIHGKIRRKDWALNWNASLETGGVLVSDEVRISGEVQFAKNNND
jgi:polyisoprenoid-binding protein YceI